MVCTWEYVDDSHTVAPAALSHCVVRTLCMERERTHSVVCTRSMSTTYTKATLLRHAFLAVLGHCLVWGGGYGQ